MDAEQSRHEQNDRWRESSTAWRHHENNIKILSAYLDLIWSLRNAHEHFIALYNVTMMTVTLLNMESCEDQKQKNTRI